MGELPNASLPQSYHGDRITPEQASSFSSLPTQHQRQPLSNTCLVVVHTLLLCPSTGLYFFFWLGADSPTPYLHQPNNARRWRWWSHCGPGRTDQSVQ